MTIDKILYQITLGKPSVTDNTSMFRSSNEKTIFVVAKDYADAVKKGALYLEYSHKTESIIDMDGGINKDAQEWGDFIKEVKIISNEVII